MPSAGASGASCVQRFDGSRNSAIHTTYRISLRSSSIREPRYPLLRVVIGLWPSGFPPPTRFASVWFTGLGCVEVGYRDYQAEGGFPKKAPPTPPDLDTGAGGPGQGTGAPRGLGEGGLFGYRCGFD
mgnify:FL=1